MVDIKIFDFNFLKIILKLIEVRNNGINFTFMILKLFSVTVRIYESEED